MEAATCFEGRQPSGVEEQNKRLWSVLPLGVTPSRDKAAAWIDQSLFLSEGQMKKNRIVTRVSISLNAQTLDALDQALGVRYGAASYVTRRERGSFMGLAIFAYSIAVARLGKEYSSAMLACDVRRETPEERAFRLGEPLQQELDLPDNIVALFPEACATSSPCA